LAAAVKPLQPKDFQPALEPGEVNRLLRAIGELDEFKGRTRNMPEVLRVRSSELDPLDTTIERYASSALTDSSVKQLHNLMLRESPSEKWHRGEYKRFRNSVEATNPDGGKRVVFETASPVETPRLMQALLGATNAALENNSVHPVIVAARFALELLCIAPFQHENQPLAPALAVLILRRAGYGHATAMSLQRIFNEDPARYSAALGGSQAAMRCDPTQFGHWLLFVVNSVVAQKRSFESNLERERVMLELPQLQERILQSARGEARITTTAVSRALDLPARTARHHLELLGRNGFLQAHGDKRGRYYTLNS
jgi:Fic family protein